jgi:hypothetical protein
MLEMEVIVPFETLMTSYKIAQCHNTEGYNPNFYHWENLKSDVISFIFVVELVINQPGIEPHWVFVVAVQHS